MSSRFALAVKGERTGDFFGEILCQENREALIGANIRYFFR